MKTERDLFEAWAKKETNWDLYWSENIKQYMDHQTNGAWFAWQARVPEGYVVVPKEPTDEMISKAQEDTPHFYHGDSWYGTEEISEGQVISCYEAMIEVVEK